MAVTALTKRHFTQEEYLALESKAPYKSQYVSGEIFAMAGAQPWHVKITGNIVAGLHARFRGRPCDVFFTDMRLRVKSRDLVTYPDVMALCGEPVYDTDSNPQSLLNPQVIFEVLSPSTEAFDRGEKFVRYRAIETLTEYVLVAPEQMRVEHYARQTDGRWLLSEYQLPEQAVPLECVGCALPLAEIYERVNFPRINEAPAS
jgi:Uma2 family endonuclease